MVAGLSVVPFPGGRKCRPGHWNRTVVQLIHSYLVPSQSTVVQCGVFGAGGFSSALTLAPLMVSWAIEKTATMIAYGANALMTSTAESPSGRPCLRTYAGSSTAPPAGDVQQDERHDERDERGLPAGHRAEVLGPADVVRGQHGDRVAQAAEGHRRGVGDQGYRHRPERAEPDRDQHDRGDRDRRAATGQRLDQRAEAERDHDGLDPLVVTDPGEGAA